MFLLPKVIIPTNLYAFGVWVETGAPNSMQTAPEIGIEAGSLAL